MFGKENILKQKEPYKTSLPLAKLLLVADLHNSFPEDMEAIRNAIEENPDAVFLMGDIYEEDAKKITEYANGIPTYYVLGNHDKQNQNEGIDGLKSLDGQITEINGIRIGGVGGAPRYKPGKYAMRSEEEVENVLSNLGDVDILISHESPYHFMSTNTSHSGYQAITKYLATHPTQVHFFGHHHWREVGIQAGVREYGIYKVALYTTDGNLRHFL